MAESKDVQNRVHTVRSNRGFSMEPVQILAMLTEEVGEVAKALKPTWSKNYGELDKENLEEELADILVCTMALASRYEIDLEKSLENKFFGSDAEREWKSEKPRQA